MPDNSNILERVKELSYSHGLTLAELERRLGFSNGSIRRWNTNRPSAERIIKTADFLMYQLITCSAIVMMMVRCRLMNSSNVLHTTTNLLLIINGK